LITGGAGFIGGQLARLLVGRCREVAVLDSLHPQVHGPDSRSIPPPVEATFLTGDVTSPSNWDTVFQRVGIPDVLVHLAAETGTGQSLTEASRHGATNVLGTTQVLDAFTRWEAAPSHLVLASSRAVYGEGSWAAEDGQTFYPDPRSHEQLLAGRWDPSPPGGGLAVPLPSRADRTRPEPTNIYAATKLAQEHVLRAWGAAMQVPVSVLRLQNVYGPGQSLTNSYTGIVALFCRLAAEGNTIDVYEDGRIVRDFVHIEDVARALLAALERPPASHRVLDVGSGRATTVHDLADTIARIAGAPQPKVSGRFRDGDVRAAHCDIGPAQEELGWAPTWTVEAGLEALISWIGRPGLDGAV
jgi:dTDP-L-rhamnose 4-epimerase